ncbi:MAG: recombination mediator RecR [Prolixibacteraceae bacterium]|nr:recombination mediator RecR [Prolixibacteraceae bacterium]
MQDYSSKLLENAVNQIAKLPGIGKRTAVRLALHLLKQPQEDVSAFTSAILSMRNEIFHCSCCYNISDGEQCEICNNPKRNKSLICVVQDIRDVIAIENTHAFDGVYHVLGGVISPMNGIGPNELRIKELLARLKENAVDEIILATNPNVEGEATALYISRLIKPLDVKVTRIAHGVPVGGDLEFVDEMTLSRALEGRREM